MRTPALALAACAAAAAALPAQRAEVAVVGGQVTDERGTRRSAVTLAPSLGWDDGRGSAAALGASLSLLERGEVLGGGSMAARAVAARLGPASLAVAGGASGLASGGGYRAAEGRASPRVELGRGPHGVSAGPFWGAAGQTVVATADGLFPGAGREMRWTAVRGVAAEGWTGRGPLWARAGWTASRTDALRWRDATATAGWGEGRLALSLTGGVRSGDAEGTWMSGRAAVRAAGRLSVVAEAGGYPADPLLGRARGRYASVGLSLRGGAAGPITASRGVVPGPDGRVPLTLRAPRGARVEVAGGWNAWRPEPVRETEPGVYVARVALGPGRHRFAFRVDGRWTTPAGYETVADGFGGRSAVVRVAGRE
jgi:hypothetical protein